MWQFACLPSDLDAGSVNQPSSFSGESAKPSISNVDSQSPVTVVPTADGHLRSSRHAVLDAFAALGVQGEGLNHRWPVIALSVPPDANLARVHRLLVGGEPEGRWDYEEACIGDAWELAPGAQARTDLEVRR